MGTVMGIRDRAARGHEHAVNCGIVGSLFVNR